MDKVVKIFNRQQKKEVAQKFMKMGYKLYGYVPVDHFATEGYVGFVKVQPNGFIEGYGPTCHFDSYILAEHFLQDPVIIKVRNEQQEREVVEKFINCGYNLHPIFKGDLDRFLDDPNDYPHYVFLDSEKKPNETFINIRYDDYFETRGYTIIKAHEFLESKGKAPTKRDSVQSELELDTAKEMYEQGGAARKYALNYFEKETLEDPGWPENWRDLINIEGYRINSKTEIEHAIGYTPSSNSYLVINIAPTKEDCQSMLAFCQLRQLAERMNDGWEPEEGDKRFTVGVGLGKVGLYNVTSRCSDRLIPFKTKEMAKFSLEHHKELWKQYYKLTS